MSEEQEYVTEEEHVGGSKFRAGEEMPQRPARTTVVLNIYQQHPDHDVHHVVGRFQRLCETNEQQYVRWTQANGQWAEIDTGWIAKPGLIIIENRGVKPRQGNPDEGELARLESAVVKVAIVVSYQQDKTRTMFDPKPAPPVALLSIPPGHTYPLPPEPGVKVLIRTDCRDAVQVTTTVLPG